MKQNFDESLKMLLHHEGGYVWDKRDPGGETMKGDPCSLWAMGGSSSHGWRDENPNRCGRISYLKKLLG